MSTRKAPVGHAISSKNTSDVTECMKLCLVTEQCKSFYFSNQLKCEVRNASGEVQAVDDQEDFFYYERASFQAISP